MKKKLLLITLLAVAALALAACTPQTPAATATPVPQTEQPSQAPASPTPEASPEAAAPEGGLELTLEELAKFNGKDGARAYVAVDGIIYDVTDSAFWKDGAHNGFEAGKDLTAEIKEKSPHGVAKLENVKEIGKLVTE